MIVVDTNIVAYLLIEGGRTSACRSVFTSDPEWCVPFLWRSEFRNVLTTHMRHAGMPLQGAKNRMTEAEKLFADREYSVASNVILTLTNENPISSYDAEFVCLAMKLDTKLVTTDQALLKRFQDIALDPETFSHP